MNVSLPYRPHERREWRLGEAAKKCRRGKFRRHRHGQYKDGYPWPVLALLVSY